MTSEKLTSSPEVEALLSSHAPDVRALVGNLRALILSEVPEARETVNSGWHSLNYSHPRSGYFCGIFPEERGAKLVYEFGILLPDPEHLLQGDGRQVRFVPLEVDQALPEAGIRQLIQAALDLPEKHRDRLALVRAGARPGPGKATPGRSQADRREEVSGES